MGAISGDVNTNPMLCINDADLASRPLGSKQRGDMAYVVTHEGTPEGPYFFYNPTATNAAGAGVIVPTGQAVGRWLSIVQYAGAGASAIAVANYAAMDLLDANGLGQGTELYMIPQHAYWTLRLGTAPAGMSADEVRTANSAVPKWWERESQGSDAWFVERLNDEGLIQINGDTGSDDAIGSTAFPLRTLDEVLRRTNGVSMAGAFLEIDVLGTLINCTKLIKFTGTEHAFVFISGTTTVIGSGLVTTTDFNRGANPGGAGNQTQLYAATIAGQPLTSYISTTSAGYMLSTTGGSNPTSGTSGWIIQSGGGANVKCPTFSVGGGRLSIASNTTVFLHKITSYITGRAVVDATDVFIEMDAIGFNDRARFLGQFELEHCFVNGRAFFNSAYNFGVFNKSVAVAGFECDECTQFAMSSCTFRGDSRIFGGEVTVGPFTLFDGQITFQAGSHVVIDQEVRINTGAGVPANIVNGGTTVLLNDFLWGGANGGTNPAYGYLIQPTGAFVAYINATGLTLSVATALGRLLSASGVSTTAADSAALPIRDTNSFLGFVN